MKSNLDLSKECDRFPYYDDDPEEYSKLILSYFKFRLEGETRVRGYMPTWVAEQMPWTEEWTIDDEMKTISPCPKTKDSLGRATASEQSRVIEETLKLAKKDNIFEVLNGWRNELYPVNQSLSAAGSEIISIERSGSPLFGVVTYGIHMTAYVKQQDGSIKIWVPQRAKSKQTYGGMLDNTVAGGLSTGESPFECLIREAAEEASFPESLIRSSAKACGVVSYFYVRDERAGGETGLLQPEVEYVYDMEIGPNVSPKPADGEVEEFYLWTVKEVQEALSEGQFKPNCAVVLLDFFVRHGILNGENEEHLTEIIARIHRKLPFPTA